MEIELIGMLPRVWRFPRVWRYWSVTEKSSRAFWPGLSLGSPEPREAALIPNPRRFTIQQLPHTAGTDHGE